MKMSHFKARYFLLIFLAIILVPRSVYGANDPHEKKPGVRILYLIRHGEYNQKDPRSPFVGKGLVPLGIAQARLVAARLRTYPVKFDSLYSSTMTRAVETAMVINQDFPYLKLKESPLLSECTPPSWRLKHIDPEEAKECEERLDRAFKKFFIPSDSGNKNDIIVCHGNVIRYFVTKVLGVDTRSWLNMSIFNCSLTVVKIYYTGRMKLFSYNDVGHIPPNMQTHPGGKKKPLVLLKEPVPATE